MFSCKSSSHIVLEVAWFFHNSPRMGSGHPNKVLLQCVLAELDACMGLPQWQTIPPDVLGHRFHQDNLIL